MISSPCRSCRILGSSGCIRPSRNSFDNHKINTRATRKRAGIEVEIHVESRNFIWIGLSWRWDSPILPLFCVVISDARHISYPCNRCSVLRVSISSHKHHISCLVHHSTRMMVMMHVPNILTYYVSSLDPFSAINIRMTVYVDLLPSTARWSIYGLFPVSGNLLICDVGIFSPLLLLFAKRLATPAVSATHTN